MRGYKQDKRKSYIRIAIIFIISISVLIFTGYSIKKERKLNFIEKTVKDIGVFIEETIYAPVKFVKDKIEVNKEKEEIYKKYKVLQQKSEKFELNEARIKELEDENKELKNMLDIKSSLTDYDIVNASIVSRDVGYWYDKVVINKGEKDGIENRMAVIINGGVIGYISEVSSHSANVQLLTTKSLKNKVSVKIDLGKGKYANGLLIGYDSKKKVYNIEGISYSGNIPEKAMVTTTGLGDNFPSGILIGYVNTTTTDNFDLGKIVEVNPSVDFDNLSNVIVLKRKADKE